MANTRYLQYLPLLLPPLLVASYVVASLPIRRSTSGLPGPIDPGLSSLPVNSRAREVYPEDWIEGGAYVRLPIGRVRHWLVGPKSGKKITLIHGLTIPALAYAKLVPILAGAGYHVLLYDLYGRGYSDAPQGIPYDTQLYITQLALLLQHVGWQSTRLVGFSMGGPIAAAFVAMFPALVEHDVVLIASAGASANPHPVTKFRHVPFVQGRVIRRLTSYMPSKSDPRESPMQEIARLQAVYLRGYGPALISSLCDGPVARMRWAFESSSWRGRRVLLVHGKRDVVVPCASSPLLRSFLTSAHTNPGGTDGASPVRAELVLVEDAGHDLTWTHADEVGRALLAFLDAD
ncbi:Alpha/Beta hydrolase protein [Mycena maculata]|uniref:Alpha/Beta hydrolase protein n=1 Tax=Mycena maculata TaxID=230809 RepID=A0AAD7N2U2_9AGAR|nr:Alpha/Beta hydrolase protein [Mycena maculata]